MIIILQLYLVYFACLFVTCIFNWLEFHVNWYKFLFLSFLLFVLINIIGIGAEWCRQESFIVDLQEDYQESLDKGDPYEFRLINGVKGIRIEVKENEDFGWKKIDSRIIICTKRHGKQILNRINSVKKSKIYGKKKARLL